MSQLQVGSCPHMNVPSLDLGPLIRAPCLSIWESSFLPYRDLARAQDRCLWDAEYTVPGHVIVLQTDTYMFRFTWVTPSLGRAKLTHGACCFRKNRENTVKPEVAVVRCIDEDESRWKARVCESDSGSLNSSGVDSQFGGVKIVFEACIDARALARDLHNRFRQMFAGKCVGPVGLRASCLNPRNGFRSVEVLLCWTSSLHSGGVAAYVLTHLMSKEYEVLKWIEIPPFIGSASLELLTALRVRSYGIFGSSGPTIDSGRAWPFLEETEAHRPCVLAKNSMHWLQTSKSDVVFRRPHSTCLNNHAVLIKIPLLALAHPRMPFSMHYA